MKSTILYAFLLLLPASLHAAEIIVYEEVLSDFDRRGVEMYLNEKWGLPTFLGYADGTFNEDLVGLGLVAATPELSLGLLFMGGALLLGNRKRNHSLS